jgi:ABC-type glutathione transport system ATPase component
MLMLEGITKDFKAGRRGKAVRVLDGVTLSLDPGELYGLVGTSGSGKTTLARIALGLIPASSGRVLLGNEDVGKLRGAALRAYRRRVQLIFQNPQLSLDPRQTLFEAMAEPLEAHGLVDSKGALHDRVRSLAAECGLTEDLLGRRPHQISGGQAQRAVLARALGLEPDVLIADEPTSMLDVSVQAQVLRILDHRRRERGLTICLISHDLDLVRACCDRAGVLSGGRIVSEGSPGALFPLLPHPPPVSREELSCQT